MSSKAKLDDQSAKLGELFSKCSELAAKEEKEMAKVVGTILPVLDYLGEPVALSPKSLDGRFHDLKSVSLLSGAVVVTTDEEGRVSSTPLSKLRTKECLSIVHEAFPELQRLVADKRRALQVRPALSFKVVLEGSHFIVDMRSYRLVVLNDGGDCRDLVVSSRLPEGKTKPSRPRDLGRGERIEVDTGVHKGVGGSGNLEIIIECKDVDGRPLSAELSVPLDGESWQGAVLAKKHG